MKDFSEVLLSIASKLLNDYLSFFLYYRINTILYLYFFVYKDSLTHEIHVTFFITFDKRFCYIHQYGLRLDLLHRNHPQFAKKLPSCSGFPSYLLNKN